MKSLLHLILAAGALALITGFMPLANAVDVPSQVTIVGAGQCGLTVNSGSPINYGSLANNQESGNQPLKFTNGGAAATTPGQVFVKGNNWQGPAGSQSPMSVGDTHYATLETAAYADKRPLTSSDVFTGVTAEPGVENALYWQLKPNLAIAGFQGSASQLVTLSIVC